MMLTVASIGISVVEGVDTSTPRNLKVAKNSKSSSSSSSSTPNYSWILALNGKSNNDNIDRGENIEDGKEFVENDRRALLNSIQDIRCELCIHNLDYISDDSFSLESCIDNCIVAMQDIFGFGMKFIALCSPMCNNPVSTLAQFHGFGGATGSGFGSLLVERLSVFRGSCEEFELCNSPLPSRPTSTSTTQCAGDYGSNDPCCSQGGTSVELQFQCPRSKPTCVNYVYNYHWGTCE